MSVDSLSTTEKLHTAGGRVVGEIRRHDDALQEQQEGVPCPAARHLLGVNSGWRLTRRAGGDSFLLRVLAVPSVMAVRIVDVALVLGRDVQIGTNKSARTNPVDGLVVATRPMPHPGEDRD